MNDIAFLTISLAICVFGLLTVLTPHVFHGAVWLSLCLISVSGIYFFLDASFVGVIQVLVYIGGIITLFIFAIKLTSQLDDLTKKQTNEQVFPSALAVIVLFVLMYFSLRGANYATPVGIADMSIAKIGKSLLTTYVLPFEFLSLLLLAALVGAIVIGKAKK